MLESGCFGELQFSVLELAHLLFVFSLLVQACCRQDRAVSLLWGLLNYLKGLEGTGGQIQLGGNLILFGRTYSLKDYYIRLLTSFIQPEHEGGTFHGF